MISAKVLKHSIAPSGITIITMELEFPRIILAEFNTHRMFSRNTESSRAVPTEKLHQRLQEDPFIPVYWGENKGGMSAVREIDDIPGATALWFKFRDMYIECAAELKRECNVHKQITNRLTETFTNVKSVVTSTEWDNFFFLRNHAAAQPEFQLLAKLMLEAQQASTPEILRYGEWHVPYVDTVRGADGVLKYLDSSGAEISIEDALIISAACCAQVSYRNLDDTLEKCKSIFDRLINCAPDPSHSSPVEHQATPIDLNKSFRELSGVTHMDKNQMLWSANFRGWIQHRKLIPNESV